MLEEIKPLEIKYYYCSEWEVWVKVEQGVGEEYKKKDFSTGQMKTYPGRKIVHVCEYCKEVSKEEYENAGK